jgi:hypothetical protein
MALIKEDYGLIYNDDGSLCTTARDDDIPFQGVKSYAVEEATTNLIDFSNIPNAIVACSFTKYNYKYDITTDSNNTAHVFRISNFSFTTSTATVSFYISKSSTVSTVRFNLYNKVTGSNELWGEFNIINENLENITAGYNGKVVDLKDWWYISLTADVTINNDFNLDIVVYDENKKLIIKKPQIEQKPFATSFVDGSRNYHGVLKFPDIHINSYNFVQNFWCNLTKREENILWHHIVDTQFNTEANGIFIGFRGNAVSNPNKLVLYIRKDGLGTENLINSVDGTTIKHEWHMYTVVGDNGSIKVYFDGNLVYTTVMPYNYNSDDVIIGRNFYNENEQTSNGFLISNLFIGEYKDKNGNVIWTDEYIQEVYEAKKPFNTNL